MEEKLYKATMETGRLKMQVEGLCDMIDTLSAMLSDDSEYSKIEKDYQVLIAMELVKNIKEGK